MATMTTPYDTAAIRQQQSLLRRMLAGAAVFDAVGGAFCLAAAGDIARWLSVPRAGVYVTGALFLAAASAGGLTFRRALLRIGWIVSANEVFALWCMLMLMLDDPNALGAALLAAATLSSAGTGVAELLLARRD